MGFQSVPETALFTANFNGPNGTRMSFSLASRNTLAPWDASQLTLIADDFRDAIVGSYLPLVSSDFTFVNVTSRDLEAEFGRVIEHAAVNTQGGLGSPSLPANTAVRGKFICDPGGAPRQGGIYLLPPGESQVVASLISAGPLAGLQAALEDLHNAMSAGGPAHVIISRFHGTTKTTSPSGRVFREPIKRAQAETNTVPTVVVRDRVASQRARRPAA